MTSTDIVILSKLWAKVFFLDLYLQLHIDAPSAGVLINDNVKVALYFIAVIHKIQACCVSGSQRVKVVKP